MCVYVYFSTSDWLKKLFSYWVTAAFWGKWKTCHGWDDGYWAFSRFPGLRKKWGMDDLDLGEQQQNNKSVSHFKYSISPHFQMCFFKELQMLVGIETTESEWSLQM